VIDWFAVLENLPVFTFKEKRLNSHLTAVFHFFIVSPSPFRRKMKKLALKMDFSL
jgi:hypothetical protein